MWNSGPILGSKIKRADARSDPFLCFFIYLSFFLSLIYSLLPRGTQQLNTGHHHRLISFIMTENDINVCRLYWCVAGRYHWVVGDPIWNKRKTQVVNVWLDHYHSSHLGRALSQRECVVGGGADFSADLNAVSTTAVNIWEWISSCLAKKGLSMKLDIEFVIKCCAKNIHTALSVQNRILGCVLLSVFAQRQAQEPGYILAHSECEEKASK